MLELKLIESSPTHVDKRGLTYVSVDLTHWEIVRVKGKGGKTKLRELGLEYGVWGMESYSKFGFYKQ